MTKIVSNLKGQALPLHYVPFAMLLRWGVQRNRSVTPSFVSTHFAECKRATMTIAKAKKPWHHSLSTGWSCVD
jgi:hypothetical protein